MIIIDEVGNVLAVLKEWEECVDAIINQHPFKVRTNAFSLPVSCIDHLAVSSRCNFWLFLPGNEGI